MVPYTKFEPILRCAHVQFCQGILIECGDDSYAGLNCMAVYYFLTQPYPWMNFYPKSRNTFMNTCSVCMRSFADATFFFPKIQCIFYMVPYTKFEPILRCAHVQFCQRILECGDDSYAGLICLIVAGRSSVRFTWYSGIPAGDTNSNTRGELCERHLPTTIIWVH